METVGSPPPARGKVICNFSGGRFLRITPARAGKRCVGMIHQIRRQDHPRPRGEKMEAAGMWAQNMGSPPPARGKVLSIRYGGSYPGITPARAGKRLKWGNLQNRYRDHPRPRGEKTKKDPYLYAFLKFNTHISFSFKNTSCNTSQSAKARCCFSYSMPKYSAKDPNL